MPAKRLSLAPHVRACHSDGQVVLLDLRAGKYLGLSGRLLSGLAEAVDGCPVVPSPMADRAAPAEVDACALRLFAQGLLTDEATVPPHRIEIEEATASLDPDGAIGDIRISVGRTWRVARRAAVAAAWLRWRSLLHIADSVASRRARLEPCAASPVPIDGLRATVAGFVQLRPLIFTSHDRCLHDSLALVDFLAHEALVPRWVIGIQTRPFGAHSWVQSGNVVLNDQHERVRHFRPILVV